MRGPFILFVSWTLLERKRRKQISISTLELNVLTLLEVDPYSRGPPENSWRWGGGSMVVEIGEVLGAMVSSQPKRLKRVSDFLFSIYLCMKCVFLPLFNSTLHSLPSYSPSVARTV
jgi:hypothetical protein